MVVQSWRRRLGVAPINVSYARNHLDSPARLAKLSFVYCPPLSCVVVVCLLLFVSPLVDSVALRTIGPSSQRAVYFRRTHVDTLGVTESWCRLDRCGGIIPCMVRQLMSRLTSTT